MGDQKNPEVWKAVAMQDHFEKIQKLKDKIDGVPNFRRVPGYKVYCCGQPTKEGFVKAIEKVCEKYPKDGPIVWINMRQEPIVYVNGNPVCARPPNKIGEYAELGGVTRASVKEDEEEFLRVLESRAKEGGKIKVVDVNKKESEVEVKELVTLSKVIEGLKATFPGLTHNRIPVCNSAAPLEPDFDTLCNALLGTNVNAPVIVNCQVGLSRSTTGCVAACLFREFQLSASYEGLVETVPGVNLEVLRMDNYQMDKDKDTLFRGEFEVVKELTAALGDEGIASKRECDKVIDKNGPAPKGTGIKQLRENIAESKLSYEIMDDAAQAFLKSKIQDNITKYYMLVVFTGYLNDIEVPPPNTPEEEIKLAKPFAEFMKGKADIATMIQKGKGKLKWERDVPEDIQSKLEQMATTDFFGNLGQIIHDILGTANKIYRDMADVGDHKKRAKYRFSSKTLMSLLPAEEMKKIEDKVERGEMTVDFYDILGEVQKNKPAQ